MTSPIETRLHEIKLRRKEIWATLAEWKRQFFADGIQVPFEDRLSLEAEDAALSLEATKIAPGLEAERAEKRERNKSDLLYQLIGILREKNLDYLIVEAKNRADAVSEENA